MNFHRIKGENGPQRPWSLPMGIPPAGRLVLELILRHFQHTRSMMTYWVLP